MRDKVKRDKDQIKTLESWLDAARSENRGLMDACKKLLQILRAEGVDVGDHDFRDLINQDERIGFWATREIEKHCFVVDATAPPDCDQETHKYGEVVAVLDCGMLAMEGLVKEASRKGPEMDWHYFGGRAVVKTLGDVTAARQSLKQSMPKFLQI